MATISFRQEKLSWFPQPHRTEPAPLQWQGGDTVETMQRPKKLLRELIETGGENLSKEFKANSAVLLK